MARKPGSMYHSIKQQSFTRKEYMCCIPTSRITHFVLGNKKGVFHVNLYLCSNEQYQIRHSALESACIKMNRFLDKKAGVLDYKFSVNVYPYHVLKENKQSTGAGADRVSQGICTSYRKIVVIDARIKQKQVIMSIEKFERNIEISKDALRKGTSELPSPSIIKNVS